ncbi:hypothetical protein ACFW95_42075 [Streptomyces sp. NPDC059474]|uniref:hypothetical protein n=1 Tax=Streptomyces sp. NPDC059474 TaxID=3346846 RepID=UPI0036CD149B
MLRVIGDPVPFGNSSLLLAGGLARHHNLLQPCPGDRFARIPGDSEAARGPGGAAQAAHEAVRYEHADRLWFAALASSGLKNVVAGLPSV